MLRWEIQYNARLGQSCPSMRVLVTVVVMYYPSMSKIFLFGSIVWNGDQSQRGSQKGFSYWHSLMESRQIDDGWLMSTEPNAR